jgi:small subunit ribosomal protein S7
MSRKIFTKKKFPEKDLKYNNFLVNLLINRVLKNGKKNLAKRIVYQTFKLIELKTTENPIFIYEKAIRNGSPRVQLKPKRIGGATYQVPVLINRYFSVIIAIKWLIKNSKLRTGKGMSIKLANEILETAKGLNTSYTIKKKEEIHKMAEANKAFIQLT